MHYNKFKDRNCDPAHVTNPGRLWVAVALIAMLLSVAPGRDATAQQVELVTNMGTITVELYPDRAPTTVKNFLFYVADGFYNGTIFHRVITNFMIQGGGFTEDLQRRPTKNPIKNEANNGLPNDRGTIAMSRTDAPHSAMAQFFINVVDNSYLNHKDTSARGWGYAVFGKVVGGMDVVDAIAAGQTGNIGRFPNMPLEPIIIENIALLD